jgi:type VI secretion system protein ImpK
MPEPANSTAGRTNSLALIFQELLTVIVRVRFPKQPVSDAGSFRAQVRHSISAAAQAARAAGYSDDVSRMAVYTVIAFLDESVLISRDPAFADWARRPLQQEIFGDARAGEKFFGHVHGLLDRADSTDVADILELHALCLLLGFQGKLAPGESGAVQILLSRIREKISCIRGPASFAAVAKLQSFN